MKCKVQRFSFSSGERYALLTVMVTKITGLNEAQKNRFRFCVAGCELFL